jgi:nitroreductase
VSADTSPADAVRPLLRVHQVREFTDEPVSADALDAIADAARWSGSSRNTQPWRFVILRSIETLRTIAAAGLPQTRSLQTAAAAVAIVLPEASGMGISHAYDEGRAAERMLIAASFLDLGAGVAWILPPVRPLVASLLELPEGRYVRTIVAVGHPSAAARRPKSTKGAARLPREEAVFYEKWVGLSGDL